MLFRHRDRNWSDILSSEGNTSLNRFFLIDGVEELHSWVFSICVLNVDDYLAFILFLWADQIVPDGPPPERRITGLDVTPTHLVIFSKALL